MSNQLSADTTWFNITTQSGNFSVYAFAGKEEVHKPYEFAIELVSRSSSEDLTGLLGTPACLSITDRSGEKRLAHGLIREMEQLHTANSYTHYRAVLVPRLWFLGQMTDHRIFQNMSVVEITERILKEQGFPGKSVSFKLFYTYEPREYCVQYGETSLHFLSRIMEEEGIFYYFEHTEESHTLCFCDREGGPLIAGESDIRFDPGSGQAADTAVISRLKLRHKVNSNAVTYKEWNCTMPPANLTVSDRNPRQDKAPTPPGMDLEVYQYPHLYELSDPGKRYARLQLMRQLTYRQWIECESDVCRYLPTYSFTIHDHPREDVNVEWWVVSVEHEGKQPGVLEHESPDGRGLEYKTKVVAIPHKTRFIPALEHPKRQVIGEQTAIVTGPDGEELFPDKYGRVKVQFHWDREGKRNERTSCWIRVSQGWAGGQYGMMALPRIGHEVVVSFLEGNPDRPLITGRVYNETNMPPWELPKQKSLSGIQSKEIRGTQRNQLLFDDSQGQVQTQLSSDHGLSQLNLGHITRVRHIQGRDDFRGEGFELRTDAWGVVRAAKGLYISTDTRERAKGHQKDISEANTGIANAASQHEETAKLAASHKAQDALLDGEVVAPALRKQSAAMRGPGKAHGELTEPHMVLSSPAGIAITTPQSTHIHTMENTAITTGRHLSASVGKSFLVSALDKVSLYAQKLGMKLFAGEGKVAIQAQSDDLDIIAAKVVQIISTQKSIHITAAEEITLAAGGSYIRVSDGGIEQGTTGRWVAYAASHAKTGPASLNPPMPVLPEGGIQFQEQCQLTDEITGDPLANMRYQLRDENGSVVQRGVSGADGLVPLQQGISPGKMFIRILNNVEE